MLVAMHATEQSPGISIFQHGQLVAERQLDLIEFLRGEDLRLEWRLPSWLTEHRQTLRNALLCTETLQLYAVFHDCGKPYCVQLDEKGRRHFPDHAKVSAETWLRCNADTCENQQIARLMAADMDIHTMSASEAMVFSQRPEAASLLITGLAEIHANAEMFGGLDSTGFKIKFKQIDRRGRVICNELSRFT